MNKVLDAIIILLILALILATFVIVWVIFNDNILINKYVFISTIRNTDTISILSVLVAISALATPVIAYIHSSKIDAKEKNIITEVEEKNKKFINERVQQQEESLKNKIEDLIKDKIIAIPKILTLVSQFDFQYKEDEKENYRAEVAITLFSLMHTNNDSSDDIRNLSSKLNKDRMKAYNGNKDAQGTKHVQYFIDVLVALYEFDSFHSNKNKLALKKMLTSLGIDSAFWETIHKDD